jgi:hypothetical protein
MIYLSGAAVGLQDYIVEHGVFFRKLSKNAMDVKLSFPSFVFGGFPECPRNNKGNDQYYEDDAESH